MCGIIGHVGCSDSKSIVNGLKNLEYRGYDSYGIAMAGSGRIEIEKKTGMISESDIFLQGTIGIGHTRWATHGGVTEENAHPHGNENVVAVHNGVIENYAKLRNELSHREFSSETDSEIIPHMIEDFGGDFLEAFRRTVRSLEGSFAIVAMNKDEEKLYLARQNSPLIIGIGKNEMLCASDIPAIVAHANEFVSLEDGDIAVVSRTGYDIFDESGKSVERQRISVDMTVDEAKKNGHAHFMHKEIFEQEGSFSRSLKADVSEAKKLIDSHKRIDILACGTSYHAGMVLAMLLSRKGKYANAYIASDYPYVANPDDDTLIIAISQSGETADVLQAMKKLKNRKIAITNTAGSSITRISDESIFLNCGPEVGVAATKTFTSQLAIAYRLALDELPAIDIGSMLALENEVKEIAQRLRDSEHAFFLARGIYVPIAYEGSLKFKEITYIHSEAYPGGELKHGTLSLVTEGTPIIALAPDVKSTIKLLGNIKEAKARGGMVVSITDAQAVADESDYALKVPKMDGDAYPVTMIILLQLLAYHVSVLRGINPDRPRNLAKSVTVE